MKGTESAIMDAFGQLLDEKPLTLSLFYEPGQRKEGILSVMLRLADMRMLENKERFAHN